MARRRLDPQTAELLARRQAALTALTQHPSWPELEDEVDRKQQRLESHLLASMLHGVGPVDQRKIDYLRGFIAGMKWFVAVPNRAEQTLEAYLRERGVNLEGSNE